VIGCEPNYKNDEIKNIKNVNFDTLLEKADYLIYCVPHSQFKAKKDLIKEKRVLDLVGELK